MTHLSLGDPGRFVRRCRARLRRLLRWRVRRCGIGPVAAPGRRARCLPTPVLRENSLQGRGRLLSRIFLDGNDGNPFPLRVGRLAQRPSQRHPPEQFEPAADGRVHDLPAVGGEHLPGERIVGEDPVQFRILPRLALAEVVRVEMVDVIAVRPDQIALDIGVRRDRVREVHADQHDAGEPHPPGELQVDDRDALTAVEALHCVGRESRQAEGSRAAAVEPHVHPEEPHPRAIDLVVTEGRTVQGGEELATALERLDGRGVLPKHRRVFHDVVREGFRQPVLRIEDAVHADRRHAGQETEVGVVQRRTVADEDDGFSPVPVA